MPRRNVNLTVVLGDGPSSTPFAGSWKKGIAVAADGNDDRGMLKGRAASQGDDIIGWTIRPQKSGDIATLRTLLEGTIEVELGTMRGTPALTIGDALWLMLDDSGRLTDDSSLVEDARYCALALEHNKVEGELCEVYVMSQKYVIDV